VVLPVLRLQLLLHEASGIQQRDALVFEPAIQAFADALVSAQKRMLVVARRVPRLLLAPQLQVCRLYDTMIKQLTPDPSQLPFECIFWASKGHSRSPAAEHAPAPTHPPHKLQAVMEAPPGGLATDPEGPLPAMLESDATALRELLARAVASAAKVGQRHAGSMAHLAAIVGANRWAERFCWTARFVTADARMCVVAESGCTHG
jgi:hypothetical protein